jgi:dTMP kinase
MGGFFVSFEGGDGSGKTTMAKRLTEYLENEGYPVVSIREPGGTTLGEEIDALLRDTSHAGMADFAELFLFLAARAELTERVIIPGLKEGKVFVADRFKDSTVAYQGWGRGINLDTIQTLNNLATQGLSPDLTFFLNLEAEEGVRRKREAGPLDRIDQEDLEFHRRVVQGYRSMAEYGSRRWVVIDASRSLDVVFEEIRGISVARLTESGIEPRRELEIEGSSLSREREG